MTRGMLRILAAHGYIVSSYSTSVNHPEPNSHKPLKIRFIALAMATSPVEGMRSEQQYGGEACSGLYRCFKNAWLSLRSTDIAKPEI